MHKESLTAMRARSTTGTSSSKSSTPLAGSGPQGSGPSKPIFSRRNSGRPRSIPLLWELTSKSSSPDSHSLPSSSKAAERCCSPHVNCLTVTACLQYHTPHQTQANKSCSSENYTLEGMRLLSICVSNSLCRIALKISQIELLSRPFATNPYVMHGKEYRVSEEYCSGRF